MQTTQRLERVGRVARGVLLGLCILGWSVAVVVGFEATHSVTWWLLLSALGLFGVLLALEEPLLGAVVLMCVLAYLVTVGNGRGFFTA